MDFTSYARDAADLVNADLSDIDGLRSHLQSRTWLAGHVRRGDVARLRTIQRRLGAVVDASAADHGAQAVHVLNELLSAHPIRPRVSGHGATTWHLHVNDENASVAEILTGEALLGLAILFSEVGATRLGRCAAESCNDAFVDTSANNSRRFCGTRCATRTNVAALRRRRQQATPG